MIQSSALKVAHLSHIDGFVQNCSISSALAMEILQSCTMPLIYCNLFGTKPESAKLFIIIFQNATKLLLKQVKSLMKKLLLNPVLGKFPLNIILKIIDDLLALAWPVSNSLSPLKTCFVPSHYPKHC